MREEQTRNKGNVGKGERIYIRISLEEKELLKERAEKRGVNLSTYVKQMSLSDRNQNLYDTQVAKSIYHITDLLANQVGQYCKDEAFINECKRSVNELWHYLR